MKGEIHGAEPPDAALPEDFEYHSLEPLEGMTWPEIGALSEKIAFLVPHRPAEGVNGGICDHFGDWGRWGLRVIRIKDPHGGFMEAVRAKMVRIFLEYCRMRPEIEFLVMCDNDQGIDIFDPIRLARHNKPVVTGVVCGFTDDKGLFACFTAKGKDGKSYWPKATTKRMVDGRMTSVPNRMPAKGLAEVHQAGTGLLCIHKSVLLMLDKAGEYPFWIPENIRKETTKTGDLRKSEDVCFTDLCDKFGIKRYVDFSVQAIHYKHVGFGWANQGILDPDMTVEEWDVSTGYAPDPGGQDAERSSP